MGPEMVWGFQSSASCSVIRRRQLPIAMHTLMPIRCDEPRSKSLARSLRPLIIRRARRVTNSFEKVEDGEETTYRRHAPCHRDQVGMEIVLQRCTSAKGAARVL